MAPPKDLAMLCNLFPLEKGFSLLSLVQESFEFGTVSKIFIEKKFGIERYN